MNHGKKRAYLSKHWSVKHENYIIRKPFFWAFIIIWYYMMLVPRYMSIFTSVVRVRLTLGHRSHSQRSHVKSLTWPKVKCHMTLRVKPISGNIFALNWRMLPNCGASGPRCAGPNYYRTGMTMYNLPNKDCGLFPHVILTGQRSQTYFRRVRVWPRQTRVMTTLLQGGVL